MLCCGKILLYLISIVSFLNVILCKGAPMDTTKTEIIHREGETPIAPDSNVPFDNGTSSLGFTSFLELNNNTVISHILPELSTSSENRIWSLTAQSVPGGNNNENDTLGKLITVNIMDFTEVSTNISNVTDEQVFSITNYGVKLEKQELLTDNGINQKLPSTQYPKIQLSTSTDMHFRKKDKEVSLFSSISKLKTNSKQGKNKFTRIFNVTKLPNIVKNITPPYTPLHITTTAATTDKHVYVRGHKIYNPRNHKSKKSKSNIKTVSGYPLHHNKQNYSKAGREKRKHKDGSKSDPEDAFIYISQNTGHQRSFARTYAWLIGAAMLVIGSLLILLGSILLCYCREKWNKHRKDRHRREKYGYYERVESVSSLVSSHAPNHDCYDDNLETVSMI